MKTASMDRGEEIQETLLADRNRPSLLMRGKWLIYFILLMGYAQASLRFSVDDPITPFRLCLPVLLLLLLVGSRQNFNRFAVVSGFFVAYAFLCTVISWYGITSNTYIYSLHYLTIIFLCFMTRALMQRVGQESFFSHLNLHFRIMVFLSIHQLLTRQEYPNILGKSSPDAASIYYWNENDLSLALGVFIPALAFRSKRAIDWIFIALACAVIYVNSSRAVMLGLSVFLFFTVSNVVAGLLRVNAWIVLAAAGSIALMGLFAFQNQKLQIQGDVFTFGELVFDPIRRVVELDPYPNEAGSVYDRTNASIFGIKSFLEDSATIGIGPGASIDLLERPDFALATAKSLHNLPLQLMVEFGWLSLFTFLLTFLAIWRLPWWRGEPRNAVALLGAFIFFNLVCLSQSVGILSNYYFFTCMFYVFFASREVFLKKSQEASVKIKGI